MLLSAASLFLCFPVSDVSDLTEREMRAWKKVQPAVVTLLDGDRATGTAALISRDGYFIAHATALSGNSFEGRTSRGDVVPLVRVTIDETTQFVLLKAESWDEKASPVAVSKSDSGSKTLLAITPLGPIRAERSKPTYGIVNPSRRLVPMSEIFLENNQPTLSGSLLFNLDGELAGALNATLGMTQDQNLQKTRTADILPKVAGLGGGSRADRANAMALQYGPGILTAGYTINHKVLNRVVDGFLSPSRTVKHPTIGVFCKDGTPMGALIQGVTKGSEADKSGLLEGDTIYAIDNEAVRNQIDFARILSGKEIGTKLKVWIRRGGLQQMIVVEVGSQD